MDMIRRIAKVFAPKSEFEQLFFVNEYRTLAGKGNAWLWLLSLILLLTLLALGFAVGGLKTLSKRMNDPFTNWVDLQIGRAVTDAAIADIRKTFATPSIKDSFMLNDISEYVVWREQFPHAIDGKLLYRKGRTVDFDSDLIHKILEDEKDKFESASKYSESEPNNNSHDWPACGLIVTDSMLINLGYTNPKSQKKLALDYDGVPIWLDIIAVVETLPNLCDFVCAPTLFNLLTKPADETGFLNTGSTTNILSFTAGLSDSAVVESLVKKTLGNNQVNSIDLAPMPLSGSETIYRYDVVLVDFLSESQRQIAIGQLTSIDGLNAKPFYPITCSDSQQSLTTPYYIAFNFKRLDKVREFKNYMQERYGIEISMDQVKSKENFALVSSLTFFMATVLFLFGLGSIVSFINSLLRTHLEKSKSNLGTFRAFGLGNKFLNGIYTKIVLAFLVFAMSFSAAGLIVIFAIGKLFFKHYYLNIFNPYLPVSCAALIAVGLWLTQKTIKQTLLDSPGNLIYGRD